MKPEPLDIGRDTVSIYFVNAAVARLAPPACDRALAAAGIPLPLLSAVHARVPAAAFSTLWLAVARELDDEFFGLDSRGMKVGSFALICQAVLACETLDRAIKRMLRGFSLFLDDIHGELQLKDDEAWVVLHNRMGDDPDRRFADETFLILVHGLMCWLIGRRLVPRHVAFAQPRPDHAAEYTLMYSQFVSFDAPNTCLRLDAKALSAPVVQSSTTLGQFLRTAPQSVFLKYKNEDSWTARLRKRLRGAAIAQNWPVFEDLAHELGMAPTTLRRRLEAERTSFQAIKDQLRSDLAIDRLCHSNQSVDDIGAELGFADASAFHRAFKRWTGLQPGAYRLRLKRGTQEP